MPYWIRITLFLVAIVALLGGLSFYVYRRVVRTFSPPRVVRWLLVAVLVAGPLLTIAARSLPSLGTDVSRALGAAGAVPTIGLMITAVFLAAVDLLALIARRAQPPVARLLGRGGGSESPSPAPDPSGEGEERATSSREAEAEGGASEADPEGFGRRHFVYRAAVGGVLGLGYGSALYGTAFGRHDYTIEEVPIPIPGLSPRLDGYRIVQLSDIHIGTYIGEYELASAVSLVRSARPDLVVLTGDLVDHDPRFAPKLGLLVRRLEELGPRDGVVVIPGNHDYYTGVDLVLEAAREGGGRVLKNSGMVVGDRGGAFSLLGVDDVWAVRDGGPGPDLDRALTMVPEDLPRILLCHNPVYFPEAAGRVALQLSGHTHGGQVNLGIRPAHLFIPYVDGLYEEQGSTLYVNRGFGTAGPPSRIGTPPEVTLVVLTAA